MEGSLRQIRQCSTQIAPTVASAMTGSTSQWQLLLNIKSWLVLFRMRWKRTGKGSSFQWACVRKWLYVVVATLLLAVAPAGNNGEIFSPQILILLITHCWLCVEKHSMMMLFPLTNRKHNSGNSLWGEYGHVGHVGPSEIVCLFCAKNPSRSAVWSS